MRLGDPVPAAGLAALLFAAAAPAGAADGARITVTGEAIDTWCYYSGVMGGPDAVVGSAHHTCALWCAAGGVPVGLLTDDGTVYIVLRLPGSETGEGDAALRLASHRVTAEGTVWERDGLSYLAVERILADEGITRLTHEEYGVVPDFAIPAPQ
jgi:hypothetical protein